MDPLPFPLPRVIPEDAAQSQGPSSGMDPPTCTLKPPDTSKHIAALRLLLLGELKGPIHRERETQGSACNPKAWAAKSGKALGGI